MGGFGGGGHIGGFAGGAHIGGLGGGVHVGGIGGRTDFGAHGDHFGSGLHAHALHHRFGPGYGFYDSYDPNCYYPDEASKLPPWPPFCS
jgi:hypothetical protein